MPRKRKNLNPTNEDEENIAPIQHKSQNPIHVIIQNAQTNETFHNKYIRELHQIYNKTGHYIFMQIFINILKQLMIKTDGHSYADIGLDFMAKFATSYNDEDTHPVLIDTFKFSLDTVSISPTVRFRICQFVNLLLNSLGLEAALDDSICDNILKYMLDRLKDQSSNVRVQAVHAMQRLQIPDNPNDSIVKAYQFHLANDPSVVVRQAVITSIGRNFHTIPFILERLWDVDEKVRRHTYLQMSSYPVRAYKVAQRLTFLEQGLNEHSDFVKKVVTGVLLPQWFETYNKNCITFVAALKLDANESEIERFRKTAKLSLFAIFKSFRNLNVDDLIRTLPFENEYEFEKCIPIDKLNDENCLFWLTFIEYCQEPNSKFSNELESILPELSTFCNYISKYCSSYDKHERDNWKKLKTQYILLTLIEILITYDLGDEIGRNHLKSLLKDILVNEVLDEHLIIKLIKCVEYLLTEQDLRLQFIVEIIREIIDSNSINNSTDLFSSKIFSILKQQNDQDLMVQVSSLKCQIMDLREQEMDLLRVKDYVNAKYITEKLATCTDEFSNLITPYLNNSTSDSNFSTSTLASTLQPKKLTVETIIKCLQITFYAVSSKLVYSLTPSMSQLYNDFIRRQIESGQMFVRDWALKCGTAFSMLYGSLAKDVYNELFVQFYRHQHAKIWSTAIHALFDLIDRYGFDYFGVQEDIQDNTPEITQKEKSKKTSRQLYNTMEYSELPEENDNNEKRAGSSIDLMHLFGHILNTCSDITLINPLIDGLCRLVLRGHYKSDDLLSKLLLRYFNPTTEPEINQILGIFFKQLILRKHQECLQPALLPTLFIILEAPNESPLREIKAGNVIKFVINSTKPIYSSPGLNIHNTIAMSFVQIMIDNTSNKDLIRLLTKELLTLEVSDDPTLRNDLKNCLDKLLETNADLKIEASIKSFKQLLDGTYKGPLHFSSYSKPSEITADALTDDEQNNDESNNNIDQINNPNENKDAVDNVIQNDDDNNGNSNNEMNNENNENINEPNEADILEKISGVETTNEVQAEIGETKESTQALKSPPLSAPAPSTPSVPTPTLSSASLPTQELLSPSLPIPSQNLTPTTYGLDNSTQVRYLRKSMHTRRQSSSSGGECSPSPPKVRVTEDSENIDYHFPSGNGKETNSKSVQKNRKLIFLDTNASEETSETEASVDTSDNNLVKKTPTRQYNKRSTLPAIQINSPNEIPCSPNITKTVPRRLRSRIAAKAQNEETNDNSKNNNKTTKVSQRLHFPPNSADVPDNSKEVKASSNNSTNKNLDEIRDKMLSTPRSTSTINSALQTFNRKLIQSADRPYQTRRTALEIKKLNNIMTRRSFSLIDLSNSNRSKNSKYNEISATSASSLLRIGRKPNNSKDIKIVQRRTESLPATSQNAKRNEIVQNKRNNNNASTSQLSASKAQSSRHGELESINNRVNKKELNKQRSKSLDTKNNNIEKLNKNNKVQHTPKTKTLVSEQNKKNISKINSTKETSANKLKKNKKEEESEEATQINKIKTPKNIKKNIPLTRSAAGNKPVRSVRSK